MPSSRRGDRRSGPESFAEVLGRLARTKGWQHRLGAARIWEVWEGVVGEAIAAHAWPERIQGGDTLVVAVSDSIWMQELSFLKPRVIEGIRARLGNTCGVKNLRFVLGDVGELRSAWKKVGEESRAGSLEPEELERIEAVASRMVETVRDPALRVAFRRLYVLYLKRKSNAV